MLSHASYGTHCPDTQHLQPIHMYRVLQLQHIAHLESLMGWTAPQTSLATVRGVHHSMCIIIGCERENEQPFLWPPITAPPLPTTLFDKDFLVVQNDVEGFC